MPSSALNALLTLADIASVYEQSTSLAPQPTSRDMSAVASARPAKKRPVPMEITQQDSDTAKTMANANKKAKAIPMSNDSVAYPAANPNQIPCNSTPRIQATATKGETTEKKKSKQRRRKSSLASRPSFPAMLMGMLSTPQNSPYIKFLEDESRFVIVDFMAVESNLLSLHFEATDMSSLYWKFTKMLEEWGFKVESDNEFPGKDVYSHPMFKKGDWESCLKITRPDSVEATLNKVKTCVSPLLRPLAMPPLPWANVKAQLPDMDVTNGHSLASLHASLSRQMSATEATRNLCVRYGLLKETSAARGLARARVSRIDASVFQTMLRTQHNDTSMLQGVITQVQNDLIQAQAQQQREPSAPFYARSQKNDASVLQATMALQQAHSRTITGAGARFQDTQAGKSRTISPEFSQMLGTQSPSQLDALAERFITQSMERRMNRQVMRSHISHGLGTEHRGSL